ncbi:Holliday junction resolvase RuvX [Muriicola marianensis]|uniref:Holliday junction resolvase RuvX n=1 Tax=Muriicola marianensis TaxID=1324801 RepID=UPI0016695C13|nr:Holliday junction resolvase RuvX [Muriicola marianensis]
MGRIIALDYGKVRTGIAVTDPLQLIASGLTTVDTKALIPFLETYLAEESIAALVVGEPRQMDNSPSESEAMISSFIDKWEKLYPEIPVYRQDERFTSREALKSMIASGVKKSKRREKALVDEVSATLILQGYLDRIKN